MAEWRVAIGNIVARLGIDPVAVAPTVESALYPFSGFGDGQPDSPGRWEQAASGVYEAALDFSLLKKASPRLDAPIGWADLNNRLAGTPGLPANPPDQGTYFAREAIRAFWPSYQDVSVSPGETLRLIGASYVPSSSGVTELRVKVANLDTGREVDSGGIWSGNANAVAETTLDAWVDFDISIPFDAAIDPPRLSRYRVTLYGLAGASVAGGPSDDFYLSAHSTQLADVDYPGLVPSHDLVAIVGHNIQTDAVVEWFPGGFAASPWTLVVDQPTFFFVNGSASSERVIGLRITPSEPSFVEPPFLGELWASSIVDLSWCPAFPFDMTRVDGGQIRIPGGYGRQNVFSDARVDRALLKLNFEANQDGYEQARFFLRDATRYGADPLLLFPNAVMDEDRLYHGRLRDSTLFSRTNVPRRKYSLLLDEDPFPRL